VDESVWQASYGVWITTASGKRFGFDNPDSLSINDIAHHLSMLCRWNGATKKFYSVAEHSVLVSGECPPEFALEGLLHDAAEAYVGDLSTPIKIQNKAYRDLENEVARLVSVKYRLAYPWPECIHVADKALLAAEARALMAEPPGGWENFIKVAPAKVWFECWSPEVAKRKFLDRFSALMRPRFLAAIAEEEHERRLADQELL
jgi:hypothetical protein